MSIPKDLLQEKCLSDWAIGMAYRGSIAHGMYTQPTEPTSIDDKDVMAVCVPPIDYYFGVPAGSQLFPTNGTHEIKRDEWDIVVYEARKFIGLLAHGNPNVLAMLWLRPNMYLRKTPAFELLIENRQAFVGRHVYKSFTGYAYGQLHRMTHHAYEGHMGAKRKAIVDKFGYDLKNAAHLIRLLRMGAEFLKDGELYVYRDDASQLLEIKRGEWTLEQVKAESDKWFALAEQAYLNSNLPKGPDLDKINKLSVEITRLIHSIIQI